MIKIWHWPLLQSGWKGVFFLLTLIGVFLAVRFQAQQTGMASISVLAILAVTSWFWFPVQYTLGNHGVERRIAGIPQRVPWARIEGFRSLDGGIKLFWTTPSSSSTRSIFVSWAGRKEEIERAVEFYTRRKPRRHGSTSFSVR